MTSLGSHIVSFIIRLSLLLCLMLIILLTYPFSKNSADDYMPLIGGDTRDAFVG
ncbi:hypothetical protein DL93DRAFT_2091694 [Clavulina sp. PMI_390]|nr:hypothetical protein DL93DRAFT_2091694 [Clavulina sp. PMI_390]